MKTDILTNATHTLHLMESLLTICQDSAEIGNMPAEIYADMFELSRGMTEHVSSLLGEQTVTEGVRTA